MHVEPTGTKTASDAGVSLGKVRLNSVPPCLRGRMWRFVAWLLVLVVVFVWLMVMLPRWGVSRAATQLLWVAYAPLLGWLIVSFAGSAKWIHGRLAKGELPCWECGHDLAHSTGRCPECGHEFVAADVRERWRTAVVVK